METIKKIADIDPRDVPVLERVFGRRVPPSSDAMLILRIPDATCATGPHEDSDEVPSWCNVLEGMSDEDLADFDEILGTPVRLAH